MQFRFVGMLTNLNQLDAVVALYQRDVGFAFNPRLRQVTKVVVHEDRIALRQVEHFAVVCSDRDVFC